MGNLHGISCSRYLFSIPIVKNILLFLLLVAALFPGTLFAGSFVDEKTVIDTPPPESDWKFGVEIYSWAASLGGDLTVRGQSFDFGYGFGDVLQQLDMAGFVTTNLRYKRISLLADVLYIKLSPQANPAFPPFLTSNLGVQMVIANGIGLYRVWESDGNFLELGGGLRYVYNRTKATTVSLLIPATFSSSTLHSVNGVAALHGVYNFTPKFYTGFYGDIGAGDAELTWQALGSLNYRLTENLTASAGFRWLQFRSGNGNLDIAMFGPYAGLVIWF